MSKLNLAAVAAIIATIAVIPVTSKAAEANQGVQAVTEAAAPTVSVSVGKMLYSANGQRIASIYRVTSAGTPQIILNGKLVSVPVATLTQADGKVMTSLTKAELSRPR